MPEALFEELRQHCINEDLKGDWGDQVPFFVDIKTPKALRKWLGGDEHLVLMDSEASGGQFTDLEDWLFDNDIPFDRHSGSCAAFDAEFVQWRPGMVEPVHTASSDNDEDVLVPAFPVIEAYRHLREGNIHSAMTHLENVVGRLRSIQALPRFQLVP